MIIANHRLIAESTNGWSTEGSTTDQVLSILLEKTTLGIFLITH